MNLFLHGVARAVAQTFDLPEPILEVGSFQVPGQTELANLRSLFKGKEYLGVDVRPGPGVDQVADVEDLPFGDSSIGTVIAMSTFEHVRRFWKGFEEVRRVLRGDGALFVACPFYFHIHGHPADYWRFTPQALELLLEDYPTKLTGWHGPSQRPANVWALAWNEEAAAITGAQFDKYRECLRLYARQPISWSRRLRLVLAGMLVGRGHFAPYLDREKWETQCQSLVTPTNRRSLASWEPAGPRIFPA